RYSAFNPPTQYEADLANLVVPTHVQALGAGWTHAIANDFPGNNVERTAFLGLPVLVMVALFAWTHRRSPGGRLLVVALCLAVYAALGPDLTVAGHRLLPLPTVFGHNRATVPELGSHLVPLFNNVLPVRIMLYAALGSAVVVALWMTSSSPGILRWLLPALAVLMLVPNPAAGDSLETHSVPPVLIVPRYPLSHRPPHGHLPHTAPHL